VSGKNLCEKVSSISTHPFGRARSRGRRGLSRIGRNGKIVSIYIHLSGSKRPAGVSFRTEWSSRLTWVLEKRDSHFDECSSIRKETKELVWVGRKRAVSLCGSLLSWGWLPINCRKCPNTKSHLTFISF
jgi:hypothetical protein